MNISKLVDKAHGAAIASGWHDTERSVGEDIALMHSELSEALEAYREYETVESVLRCDDEKPEGVIIELADVVIRIADFCGKHGLNLEEAIKEKMRFNKTRPYRHGGKCL